MANGQNRQGGDNREHGNNNGSMMDKMRQGFENVVDAITGDDKKSGSQKNRSNKQGR